jgi:hypothetical protein
MIIQKWQIADLRTTALRTEPNTLVGMYVSYMFVHDTGNLPQDKDNGTCGLNGIVTKVIYSDTCLLCDIAFDTDPRVCDDFYITQDGLQVRIAPEQFIKDKISLVEAKHYDEIVATIYN